MLKVLLAEEVAGRERSALATRRAAAGCRPGIPSTPGTPPRPTSRYPPRTRYAPCGGSAAGRTSSCVAPPALARDCCSKRFGQQAAETGLKVAWFTLEDLGMLLRRHRSDDTVTQAIARADLVVVDDIGLLSVARDAAERLYRLVDAAYEKRSVAISSNLHPSGFDELMPKTLATATVDRLLHHAHVCQTSGDSVRLTQALAGQGVSPLTS